MTIGNTRSTFLISRLVSSPRLRFVSVLSVLLSPLLILCYLRNDGDTCQRFGSPESSICRIVTSPFSTHRFAPPSSSIHTNTTFFLFFHLTYSRWISSLPSCLWSQRIFPSLPGSRLTIVLSRCKFSTLTTRQPMVEFYLLTFPRFPLRKKEHKSYFGKNRTHDFRTSRCAAYLLDHPGDYYYYNIKILLFYLGLLRRNNSK